MKKKNNSESNKQEHVLSDDEDGAVVVTTAVFRQGSVRMEKKPRPGDNVCVFIFTKSIFLIFFCFVVVKG